MIGSEPPRELWSPRSSARDPQRSTLKRLMLTLVSELIFAERKADRAGEERLVGFGRIRARGRSSQAEGTVLSTR